MIAKVGDTIRWTINGCGKLNGTYEAKVAMVDEENQEYGVYCEYGQDLIEFDKATLVE